jgi:hypothetical protein
LATDSNTSSQHNPVLNNMKLVLETFRHNLLAMNHSNTICNSRDATLNAVLRDESENRTVVSSANNVK